MPIILRILLIVFSIIANIFVIKKVGNSKLQMSDAAYWVGLFLFIIIIAVFPNFVYRVSELTGTESPANLIYLFFITILLLKVFTLSLKISLLENKISNLVQEIALKDR